MNALIAISAIAIMLLLLAAIIAVAGFLLLTAGMVAVRLKQVK